MHHGGHGGGGVPVGSPLLVNGGVVPIAPVKKIVKMLSGFPVAEGSLAN